MILGNWFYGKKESEAEIPTGELLGILKPGTNFKGKKICLGAPKILTITETGANLKPREN